MSYIIMQAHTNRQYCHIVQSACAYNLSLSIKSRVIVFVQDELQNNWTDLDDFFLHFGPS